MFFEEICKVKNADLLVNHFLKSGDKEAIFEKKNQIHVNSDNIRALLIEFNVWNRASSKVRYDTRLCLG